MRIHPRTIPELDAALKSTKTAVKLLEESLREARAADRASRAVVGNRERIAGWSGPAGWRLQTYASKMVTCTCCGKQISAGEQHVGWRIPSFPAPPVEDAAALEADPNRRWAHVRCLHRLGVAFTESALRGEPPLAWVPSAKSNTGLAWPAGLRFSHQGVPDELRSHRTWRTP